jgi:hypothetical protein
MYSRYISLHVFKSCKTTLPHEQNDPATQLSLKNIRNILIRKQFNLLKCACINHTLFHKLVTTVISVEGAVSKTCQDATNNAVKEEGRM